MKIERVNDNQIKCTLTGSDLSARNLSLSELAYGTDKARSLFQEMLQKASSETGFDAEDAALMARRNWMPGFPASHPPVRTRRRRTHFPVNFSRAQNSFCSS